MAKKPNTTFAKIDKALNRISTHIEKGNLDQLVLTGAEQMLQIVKNQCPVKSGKLRDSLYIDTPKGRAGHKGFAQNWKENPTYAPVSEGSVWGSRGQESHLSVENLYCRIATNVPYAWFVEFGTSHSKPYPFMRPAYDTAARPIGDSIISGASDLIIMAFLG